MQPSNPQILSRERFVAELDSYDCIIDVRSPAEFALDHIPGAVNYPVLNNEERAQIGTLYKQDSPFAAKKLGAALVSRNIANHLENHFQDFPRTSRSLPRRHRLNRDCRLFISSTASAPRTKSTRSSNFRMKNFGRS